MEDILALASHEIGTPLSVALFQLEDVLSNGDKKMIKNISTELLVVKKSLYRLKHIIQNILQMRKFDLEEMQMIPQRVDICILLKGIAKEFRILAKEKHIILTFECKVKKEAYVELDVSLLLHALSNLIQNALKFTPENGSIKISLKETPGSYLIEIIDSGIGISDAQKKSIFNKFFTCKASQVFGLGLGLYLVKNIADRHGWKLDVKDTEGGGATFGIEILRTNSKIQASNSKKIPRIKSQ